MSRSPRRSRDAVLGTASVVPGILEDLENWGFPAQRLDHSLVSRLMGDKRQHRLARLTAIGIGQRVARDLIHQDERVKGHRLPRRAQDLERIPLRLIGDDGKRFAVSRERLFDQACCPEIHRYKLAIVSMRKTWYCPVPVVSCSSHRPGRSV